MKKIYSILVVYNPREDEFRNAVHRLKKQTDLVIVCNNSKYDIQFDDKKVKIFNFRDNLGIAKAQSVGMKWAFENNADFILQMDQDSIPSDNLVKSLFNCYEDLTNKGYKIGLVGPQDYDKDTKEHSMSIINKEKNIKNTNYSIVPDTLSSGSLISKDIYELIGEMDNDLFIDIVDFEYCWRIRAKEYLIIKNKDALLGHKLGYGKKKIYGVFNINLGSPFRHYYQFRNILMMMNRDYVSNYWKISQFIKLCIKFVFYPLGLKDGRERFRFMILGIKDYFKNKKGKM
ncbi:glycosyltransferase family 2 protein [Malaciobacter sp. WC5094]